VISVVIPVFNGAGLLDEQLGSLAEQTFDGDWELLVVDNGSTDDSVAIAERWMASLPLRVLSCPEKGVNAARNAGVKASVGTKLAFLDHDDVADPGWLAAMDRALDVHRLVGGRLEYERLNSAELLAGRDQRLATMELPNFRGAPHALGCNMGCLRTTFDALGGFDALLPCGADDTDFFFRAHHAGIEAAFISDAVVAYRLRDTRRGYRRQIHNYAIAQAQLDAKLQAAGMIPHQSNRTRAAAIWGHVRALADVRLWFTSTGRWRYVQRVGAAGGAVIGFARYRQIVLL
jgi:glycosyltransferase involved in cell wall biosynthesis